MKNKNNAFIHAETPDGLHFSVSAEGSGGGMLACVANLIHAMAQNANMSDLQMAGVVMIEVKQRTFESVEPTT